MEVSPGNDADWQQARDLLSRAQRIVAFTGAGISAGSGIPTFRDSGGFWQKFPPEQFARWQGLLQTALLKPGQVADFLIHVLEPIALAEPNPAHLALRELGQSREVTVVTQNIDRLHQGPELVAVHEIHGSLFEIVLNSTGETLQHLSREDLLGIVGRLQAMKTGWQGWKLPGAIRPLIGIGLQGLYRPNLVLFGDAMAEPAWTNGLAAVESCDLLLAVGTSASVYPAALLPEKARESGARVITIDPVTGGTGLWLQGPAEDILPQLVSEIQ